MILLAAIIKSRVTGRVAALLLPSGSFGYKLVSTPGRSAAKVATFTSALLKRAAIDAFFRRALRLLVCPQGPVRTR